MPLSPCAPEGGEPFLLTSVMLLEQKVPSVAEMENRETHRDIGVIVSVIKSPCVSFLCLASNFPDLLR